MKQKSNMNKWPIPAFLLMGIGIGMLLVDEIPMAIPAFTLIGLGLGILITFLTSRKNERRKRNEITSCYPDSIRSISMVLNRY
jgi:F0F1-type ATP synthase assembly protein I|tara:strand:+ start:318 stop:566 length:249 start_codon:yes stop_codon:yes gene_type:complete